MRISNIHLRNFRAIDVQSINIAPLTRIIGENNSGKSSFLAALALFFSPSPKVEEEDFHAKNVDEPIEITIEFVDLTEDELSLMGSAAIDGCMRITRTLLFGNPSDSGHLRVDQLVYPEFTECREETAKSAQNKIYKELRKKYPELDPVAAAGEIEAEFAKWESANQEKLVIQKVRGFFGAENVGMGKIKKKTEFIFVPAVYDVSNEIHKDRKSPINQLLDALTRLTIENSADYKKFLVEAGDRLSELTSPKKFDVLDGIGSSITGILNRYYGDAKVEASWQPITGITPTLPKADLRIGDDKFISQVDKVGHGLQRAVLLAVLEYVASERATNDAEPEGDVSDYVDAQSDIILAIEEPELYQHPTKQRLFSKVLRGLVDGFSKETGIRMQVIFVTHSPLFVEFTDFHNTRLIRRSSAEGAPSTTVSESSLAQCSDKFAVCTKLQNKEADNTFLSKLHIFSNEIAEGFFARCVVIVEGVSDKAMLEAAFIHRQRDPLAEGVVIANVEGKTKLWRPKIVFDALDVPNFALFDNDQSKTNGKSDANKIAENRKMQRICGVAEADCEDWPVGRGTNFYTWDGKIETYISEITGTRYDEVREKVSESFGVPGTEGVKSPFVASAMLAQFYAENFEFPKLDEIISMIDEKLFGPG